MGTRSNLSASLAEALAQAATKCGRLDQALEHNPLHQALLFRARLDAVRKQAAADGQLIDPWHLAALMEGLRLRMDSELRIIDRGQIFEAARYALGLHRWLVEPGLEQEYEIQRAEAHLATASERGGPLLTAGFAVHQWIENGGARAPVRAALVRYWTKTGIFTYPVPITGAAAFQPDTPWQREAWIEAFLRSVAAEAADVLEFHRGLERAWRHARTKIIGRRKNSHATATVDLLAAAPLLSATTLGAALGIAVKNSGRILEEMCRDEIAIEVTHRSKRRLFALSNLRYLRDSVMAPRRPDPFRGRGRPPLSQETYFAEETAPLAMPPNQPSSNMSYEYSALDHAMAEMDATIRRTRAVLDQFCATDAT